MKAFPSHNTALTYWREHFPLDSELGRTARVSRAQDYAHRKDEVLGCIPETFRTPGQPVDVLVFDSEDRRLSQKVVCHVWGTVVPPHAFFKVGEMCVSSPEFVFLQLAQKLTLAQIVALGCELCGTYVLLPENVTHPGALDENPHRIAPLTNIEKLTAFVDSAEGANGRTKAQRALKYVVEGSRSPMETMVYLLLCLPPKLGGYGLPRPELNAEIKLDEEARRIANRSTCYGDLCWRDAKLDIEYHGEVHVGASQMKSDVGRELGIEHMGWRVMTVTSPQVFNLDEFEIIAKDAASRIGKRLYPYVKGPTQARLGLREELHDWMFAK